ncbi:unnamed protein product [Caenorhabditis sp. 36 PRJEB53466]|nr:unnamed protein product [Caenorhabditis sp. 36 PRJEB53466]
MPSEMTNTELVNYILDYLEPVMRVDLENRQDAPEYMNLLESAVCKHVQRLYDMVQKPEGAELGRVEDEIQKLKRVLASNNAKGVPLVTRPKKLDKFWMAYMKWMDRRIMFVMSMKSISDEVNEFMKTESAARKSLEPLKEFLENPNYHWNDSMLHARPHPVFQCPGRLPVQDEILLDQVALVFIQGSAAFEFDHFLGSFTPYLTSLVKIGRHYAQLLQTSLRELNHKDALALMTSIMSEAEAYSFKKHEPDSDSHEFQRVCKENEALRSCLTIFTADSDCKIEQLRSEICVLRSENDRMRKVCAQKVVPIRTEIAGGWRMVSSSNLDEFLEKFRLNALHEILFLLGRPHFAFDDDKVVMYEDLAGVKFQERAGTLGTEIPIDNGHCMAVIEDNQLKCRAVDYEGQEVASEIHFIQDGQLHVHYVWRDMCCTRVYEKIEDGEEVEEAPSKSVLSLIEGEWKPVSSKNTADYIKNFVHGIFERLEFKHAIMCFQVQNSTITEFSRLYDEESENKHRKLNVWKPDGTGKSEITVVLDDKIVTAEIDLHTSSQVRQTKMFIKDGCLTIANLRDGVFCERVYEKISN